LINIAFVPPPLPGPRARSDGVEIIRRRLGKALGMAGAGKSGT